MMATALLKQRRVELPLRLVLSRRRFLVLGAASVAAAGCSSSGSRSTGAPRAVTDDYSSRFAAFEAAVEPNGDLAKVVWPDFVTGGGSDVQKLYEFQVTHGELMRYMPSFADAARMPGIATTVTVTSKA